MQLKDIQYCFGNVGEILLVVLGENDGLEPGAVGREDLFLYAANGQDFAT